MITSQIPMLAWLAVVIAICVGHNAVYSPSAALYSEMFPAHVRYSGAYWPIPTLICDHGGDRLRVRPARAPAERRRETPT